MISTISLQCADWNPKHFKNPFPKQTYCRSVAKQSHFWLSIHEVLSDVFQWAEQSCILRQLSFNFLFLDAIAWNQQIQYGNYKTVFLDYSVFSLRVQRIFDTYPTYMYISFLREYSLKAFQILPIMNMIKLFL